MFKQTGKARAKTMTERARRAQCEAIIMKQIQNERRKQQQATVTQRIEKKEREEVLHKMVDSHTGQGRVAKKFKLAGLDFSGKIPKVLLDDGIVKMEFYIHDVASLPQKRGAYYCTGIIKAHGHLWKLRIHPRGHTESNTNVENVLIYIVR